MQRIYPQLNHAAVAQYPLRRSVALREIANRTAGGEKIGMTDADFKEIQWQLDYAGLDGAEWSALEEFFRACEGRLRTFTFLDPVGNLLGNSEDPSGPEWVVDPLLSITPASSGGPAGQVFLVTNQAQSPQQVGQLLEAPGQYHYCFSVYARSPAPSPLSLVMSAAGAEQERTCIAGVQWQRVFLSARLDSPDPGVRFALRIEGGQSLHVTGLQVDAQAAPDGYRKTFGTGGVYPTTRFFTDDMSAVAVGPDLYSCSVRLVSNLERV
jgi:hypothetical protein